MQLHPEPIRARPRLFRTSSEPEVIIECQTREGSFWHRLTPRSISTRHSSHDIEQVRLDAAGSSNAFLHLHKGDTAFSKPRHVHLGAYRLTASNVSVAASILTIAPGRNDNSLTLTMSEHSYGPRDQTSDQPESVTIIRPDRSGVRILKDLIGSVTDTNDPHEMIGPLSLMKVLVSPQWLSECLTAMNHAVATGGMPTGPITFGHGNGALAF